MSIRFEKLSYVLLLYMYVSCDFENVKIPERVMRYYKFWVHFALLLFMYLVISKV